jgi:hypothetical protein
MTGEAGRPTEAGDGSRMNPWIRSVLGSMQILGGMYGLGVLDGIQARMRNPGTAGLLLVLTIGLFYAANIVSGLLLWRNHRWGPSLAAALQIPQLIQLHAGFACTVYCGGQLTAAIGEEGGLRLDWNLGSGVLFQRADAGPASFGINILALAVLWHLLQLPDDEPAPSTPDQNAEEVAA